jgi:hypothetical protein
MKLTARDEIGSHSPILVLYWDGECVGHIHFHENERRSIDCGMLRYTDRDQKRQEVCLVGATRYTIMNHLKYLNKYFGWRDSVAL